MLKQGRAYGLGVVLTTQNPVDLDYKGLTNTGTWFIGKLQTERDKARVLEGLESAAQVPIVESTMDYSEIIGKLRSRVFLLHNVHDDSTKIFHTRWAMNYLRGPLTGVQIRKLMNEKREPAIDKPAPILGEFTNNPPHIDSKIEQYYIELSTGHSKLESRVDGKIRVLPSLMLKYNVRFFNKKRGIDKTISKWAVAPEPNNLGEIEWGQIREIDPQIIYTQPVYSTENLVYSQIPSQYNTVKELNSYRKKFSDYLYRSQKFLIGTHPGFKLFQTQNESRADFIGKVKQAAREERDAEIDKLEKKYDSKLDRINSRIDRLTGSLSADKSEYDARKREEIFGIGESVLGVLLGRRRTTGITTASRRRRMTTKTKYKIDETKKEIEQLKQELDELEIELKEQAKGITEKWESVENDITEYSVTPRKTDVAVDELKIAWIYYRGY